MFTERPESIDNQVSTLEAQDPMAEAQEAFEKLELTNDSCARHTAHSQNICEGITQAEIPSSVTEVVNKQEQAALEAQLKATQEKLEEPKSVLTKHLDTDEPKTQTTESSFKLAGKDANTEGMPDEILQAGAEALGAGHSDTENVSAIG